MNECRLRRLGKASTVLLCTVLMAACQPKVTPVKPLTAEESSRIDVLTKHMTPRCVGRYRFELPDVFVLDPRADSHRVEIEGITVRAEPMKLGEFERRFEARKAELEREVQVGKAQGLPHLRAVLSLPQGDARGGVFDRAEYVHSPRSSRELELVSWRNGFQIRASIKALDLTLPEEADQPSMGLNTDFQEKLTHLLTIHERLRGRPDDEVPDEPGFCFPNGFLRGAPLEHEMTSVSYTHLAVEANAVFTGLNFTYANDVGPDKSLLEREAAFKEEVKRKQGSTLRYGHRQNHGLQYEEWLMSKVASDPPSTGLSYYDLRAEMNSKHGNREAPLFMMDLRSQLTLTAAESVALWDRVTSTLRPQTKRD